MTTIDHKMPEEPKCAKYDNSPDLMRVFLDMDLAIFGEDWDVYVDYCNRLRHELKHMDDK